ncbi:FCD domain-containing protein [Paenibacillus xerothermodurans]|uniref:FCD domain-containing protein n=1 Tax=Paenibacillus xerothermodurans TaxID=1977292 RepID=UPI000B787C08|nr:FCD domain-containing protein [Paenibacillus xerothermodurans]
MIDSISTQMQTAIGETRRLQMYSDAMVSKQLWEEHKSVFEAIHAQNAEAAQQAMRFVSRRAGAATIFKVIKSLGKWRNRENEGGLYSLCLMVGRSCPIFEYSEYLQ